MSKKAFSRIATLARVKPKSLDSFIYLLYAASAVLAKDETLPKLAQNVTARAKDAAEVDAELGTKIVPMLVQIVKSNDYDEEELSKDVRELRKAIRRDVDTDAQVNHDHIDMLKALTAYISSRAEGALRKLISLAPLTEANELIDALTFKPNSQKEFLKPLEKIVNAFHRKGTTLTSEEQKVLKVKSPKVHKEYLRLRKEFNNVWKDELRNLINKAGRPMTDFQYALDYLKSQGIQNPLPPDFEGNVDANGKFYTKTGKLIANVPGVGFKIVMNPDYDPKEDNTYVFTTVNAEGKVSQHVYTTEYRKKTTDVKFKKVDELDAVIDSVRKKWMKYVKQGGSSVQAVASTVLELIYQFSARVGSMGNATAGQDTYGISTLLCKQVKVGKNSILIKYPGKKGVIQSHLLQGSTVEAKWLIRNIKECLVDKDPTDRVFTFDNNGKLYPVTGNISNKWFAKLGSPVTVHKLRHVKGSRLFAQELADNDKVINNPNKPLNQAQADALFKQMATKVGELLGHVTGIGKQQKVTPMTAVQNYISPALMIGYYQRLNLRPPKFLSKFE